MVLISLFFFLRIPSFFYLHQLKASVSRLFCCFNASIVWVLGSSIHDMFGNFFKLWFVWFWLNFHLLVSCFRVFWCVLKQFWWFTLHLCIMALNNALYVLVEMPKWTGLQCWWVFCYLGSLQLLTGVDIFIYQSTRIQDWSPFNIIHFTYMRT